MHETAHPIYEQVAIASANKTIAGGSIAAAAGGAAVKVTWIAEHGSEIATVCSMGGLAVAILGLIISVVFQIRRDRREQLTAIWDRRCGTRGTRADRKNG